MGDKETSKDKAAGKYWIGFDLGGTKMMATLYDAKFTPIGRARKKTRPHEGLERGMERIVKTIHEALQEAKVDAQGLAGIGIGTPGPLDLDRGVILATPNLGWKNVNLKGTLEKTFGCPAVVLNDVDAGVYGEFRFGAGRGARCVVGIFPGTGIGGGCVYEGKIIRGRTNSVLEIGHMQVMPQGPLCGCGRRGCLEAVSSRLAISTAAAAAAYRGEAPTLLANVGMDLSNIGSNALAASVQGGDKAVEKIIRLAAQWYGVAAGNIVNLLGPDVIVLGGGLVAAMPKLIRDEVEKAARDRVMPSFADIYQIVVAELGDDANSLGAAAWAHTLITESWTE
ncbi:MAG: transcriptional regulator [Lentisphaerae bacterium RIFOXYB12_FULL_65_16]|nr:MAG: transcriptional regulator [Lentisphaerae bacterium RIFOXYA12_64_32]OGV87313.1 MAG: transcriptional regulator [Lentisphaerae bacterium RIFOXYB12_FULL_65_16]